VTETLAITQAELDALPDYSRSLPTFGLHDGQMIGCRMWKRRAADGWMIGKASRELAGGWVRIEWFTPEITGGAA
jgi:hypothetical protein